MMSRGGEWQNVPTLREYVVARHGSVGSQYARLAGIKKFFEWIASSFADEDTDDIAGPTFKAPILEDDLPKQLGKKKAQRTNKPPINSNVLPHLLLYLYALEEFGVELQRTGKDRDLSWKGVDWLRPDEIGLPIQYSCFGVDYDIREVPNRVLKSPDVSYRGCNLTRLRMIILALETGMRLASARWLCMNKFANYMVKDDGRDTTVLSVNTNKSSPPYTTVVKKRVRDLLYREIEDRKKHGLEDEEFVYEDREYALYDPVTPVFRNPKTGKPIQPDMLDYVWTAILEGFQDHWARHGGAERFVSMVRPKEVSIEYTAGLEQYAFCRLDTYREYTLHSCRSTFINRRAQYIELGDISELVGHHNKASTSYYRYTEYSELEDKVRYADHLVHEARDKGPTASTGAAYTRADQENSAFSRSFSQDRVETIRAFGVISLEHSLKTATAGDGGVSGLDVLKASPLSQLIQRPTHVCPVGEQCPDDVVVRTGELRRCGLCPLACKSIDHLPAISAKINQLTERVRTSLREYQRLQEADDTDRLGQIWDAIDPDIQERTGWQHAEQILLKLKDERASEEHWSYHVEKPELVREHIERVVQDTALSEFMLQRIVETNEFSTLETPEIKAVAGRIRRKVMADGVESASVFDEEENAIKEVASMLKHTMSTHQLGLKDVAKMLDAPVKQTGTINLLADA